VGTGLKVLVANIPAMFCAGVGGVLVECDHPWFAAVFLVLAFALAHSIQGKSE
jgi:hypothetical protein